MQMFVLRTAWLGLALSSIFTATVDAQIVNTLRGFEDEEPGWSGGVAGGVAYADGNTEYFEIEVDGRIQLQTDRHRARAIGIYMRRTALDVDIAEARLGHLRHNYRLWSRLSTVAFVQGQYNPFIRIQSRILLGGGVRLDVFRGNLWKSAVGLTVMSETEELTDTQPVTSVPSNGQRETRYRLNCFFTLYRAEKEGLDIDIWGFYQPVVDDMADARVSAAASLQVDIVGGLYFFTNYIVRYDENPPEGVEQRDHLLRSGLGWSF